jgi:LmbE family N-acetylglucosaminyl deacetylase
MRMAGTVVALFAHPDDRALIAGGTWRCRRHGATASSSRWPPTGQSQTTGAEDSGGRTLAAVLRLRDRVSRVVLGREYFPDADAGTTPVRRDPLEAAR